MLDVRKLFGDYINRERSYGRNEPLELFHPSSLGYCKRQIFRSKAELTKFPFVVQGAMDVGSILHEWAENNLFKPTGAITEKYILVKGIGETYLKGRLDILHEGVVYDLKFIGKNYLPKSPLPHHVSQLNCYMLGARVRNGCLVYVSKMNLALKIFELEFNKDLYVSDIMKVKEVYDKLLTWKKGDVIPFEKCGCYFCENEYEGSEGERL